MSDYDLELDRAVEKIKSEKASSVLIQLADGLKPRAKEVQGALKEKTNAKVFIWAGSCFGACDIPVHAKSLGIDLIIQFGHSDWA